MAVFFVYLPDGGDEYSQEDIEYSPNAEKVKRELASRVRTGQGETMFVQDMAEISRRGLVGATAKDGWPEATDSACMAVWRTRGNDVPTGLHTEVWRFSGVVDRPTILPVDDAPVVGLEAFGERKSPEAWISDERMRVPGDVFRRRLAMGWDVEQAMTKPLGLRTNSVRAQYTSTMNAPIAEMDGAGHMSGGREVHEAFGMSKTIAEWAEMTRITPPALRHAVKRQGLEKYLRARQWYPDRKF